MTIKELRDYVDEQRTLDNIPYHVYSELIDGIDALEQEPSGDAIDRKLVCAFIAGLISDDGEREKGLEYIRHMPPVTPQHKTGRWIFDYTSADGHKTYHCSECGCYLKPKHSEPLNSFKWCSLCGAKMFETQESNNKT